MIYKNIFLIKVLGCLIVGVASVLVATVESRRREADAEEVRARRPLPPVTTSALPLRRLHVASQVCYKNA